MTDYFAPEEKRRIEETLSQRTVFSDRAKALLDKNEAQGGLTWDDANALIAEGTQRIFKWTAQARDYPLYKHLCDSGFKIAADICCFERHHLNHLTGSISDADVHAVAQATLTRLTQPDLDLRTYKHAGFKDFTEGPSEDTPILLRQDAYKALTEPVTFTNPDGTTTNTTHTARFGEIEQRFYAATPKGRDLYDACLTKADGAREADPSIVKRDFAAYEAMYAAPFKPFPKTLRGLLEAGLAFGKFSATPKGIAAAGTLQTTDVWSLVRDGYATYEGQRYEDFLPVSAAGIFASNLNQYGTKSTAAVRPTYSQAQLENIMGKKIIDTTAAYAGTEAKSLLAMYAQLGLTSKLDAKAKAALEAAAVHAA
jgi:uncharacterized glyoxalase superfamily metalloenzyme YdcJ